jgi:hypothetical protein
MLTTRDNRKNSKLWFWVTPVFAISIGVLYFIAGWLGGDRGFAIFGLTLMVAIAVAVLVLSRYSETVAGLLSRRDERINAMDATATNVAGMVVIGAVIIGFVVEISRGEDGMPYSMLGALGGVAYVAALIVLRLRK